MSATPTCFKMMATADSKGASSQHYTFRGHQTCPRVTLTIDYDAKSTSKTPTSPKDLHDAIVSRGVSAACIIMHAPRPGRLFCVELYVVHFLKISLEPGQDQKASAVPA